MEAKGAQMGGSLVNKLVQAVLCLTKVNHEILKETGQKCYCELLEVYVIMSEAEVRQHVIENPDWNKTLIHVKNVGLNHVFCLSFKTGGFLCILPWGPLFISFTGVCLSFW